MSSENETIEDIAKMMRRNEEVFHHLYWCEYADRIEAAHKREVAELRAKLKVAEDALVKLQDRLVSGVYDGTIDPYEALKITEDALATIRKKGAK